LSGRPRPDEGVNLSLWLMPPSPEKATKLLNFIAFPAGWASAGR
jgi:hypothetical protein